MDVNGPLRESIRSLSLELWVRAPFNFHSKFQVIYRVFSKYEISLINRMKVGHVSYKKNFVGFETDELALI